MSTIHGTTYDWTVSDPNSALVTALRNQFNLDLVIAMVLVNRGITLANAQLNKLNARSAARPLGFTASVVHRLTNLIGKPDLIIADEPTSALDAGHKAQFVALLLSQAAQQNTAVLLVSHDPRLAQHCARREHMERWQA